MIKTKKIHRPIAFTLVELLVVISIISLLISTLLPALGNSRAVARSMVCMSNERQIGVGFVNYAATYRDLIPPIGSTYQEYWGGPDPAWYQNLGRAGMIGTVDHFKGKIFNWYNNRYAVLRDPAEAGGNYDPAYTKATYYDSELVCSSYIMNWNVSQYDYGVWYNGNNCYRRGWLRGPDNLNPKYQPSEAMIVTDIMDYGIGWALPYWEWNIDNTTVAYVNYYDYAFRHPNNTANFLYMDSHVGPRKHVTRTNIGNWQNLWVLPPSQG